MSDVIGQLLLGDRGGGRPRNAHHRFSPAPSYPPDAIDEIGAEGARLLALVAPAAAKRTVSFEPSP